MEKQSIPPARKRKIKKLFSMMNRQNKRFILVTSPFIEMMDIMITDAELDFLLKMGIKDYGIDQALKASGMIPEVFEGFFDNIKRKTLVHIGMGEDGRQTYRLNAIAVGWYEGAMLYMMGRKEEKQFAEKFEAYFKSFRKFNVPILRGFQNLFVGPFVNPTQDAGLMKPTAGGQDKKKTIPINAGVSTPGTKVYPTFIVNELIEAHEAQDDIFVFPCICRHGGSIVGTPCRFSMPKESCIIFGEMAKEWASWGYGRKISMEEALALLSEVRDKGAIHSVIHEKDDYRLPVLAICNCCWDCCGILKSFNMGVGPLKYNSDWLARIKEDADCNECGLCQRHCPTAAVTLKGGLSLNPKKCIGCGQCALQCPRNNIEMYPLKRMVYVPVPKKSECRINSVSLDLSN